MKINKVFIKSVNWALAGMLSLLGFVSCKKTKTELEYGSPYADYTLKGTVVNKATGKPITGIRVGYDGYSPEYRLTMYGTMPVSYMPKAYVKTNSRGEFTLTDVVYDGGYVNSEGKRVMPVFVEDIDSEENGLFQSRALQVDYSEAELTKKPKNWYEGEYTVTIQVALDELEAQ